VTACSADLRSRALRLGADEQRSEVVPYGVDADRFRPDAAVRAEVRASLGIGESTPMVFAAGRFVRKKGFEYLIEAIARLAARESGRAEASASATSASATSSGEGAKSRVMLVMGGDGDLRDEFVARARDAGIAERVRFVGLLTQDAVARYFAAADVIAAPSVRDDSGNVDGLPNVVLEALASATPLVATPAGGIASAVDHDRTGLLVPERDPEALAAAIASLLESPSRRRALSDAARTDVMTRFGWARAAERFEHAYTSARAHHANRAHHGR
jgi:glycosyltransferase involved in cell wall biosynthesis